MWIGTVFGDEQVLGFHIASYRGQLQWSLLYYSVLTLRFSLYIVCIMFHYSFNSQRSIFRAYARTKIAPPEPAQD